MGPPVSLNKAAGLCVDLFASWQKIQYVKEILPEHPPGGSLVSHKIRHKRKHTFFVNSVICTALLAEAKQSRVLELTYQICKISTEKYMIEN